MKYFNNKLNLLSIKSLFSILLINVMLFGAASLHAAATQTQPSTQSEVSSTEKVESIIERIDNIADVLPYVDGSTAALFDIDVTLIASDDPYGIAGERWLVDLYGKRIDTLLNDNLIDPSKFRNELASSLWWFVKKRPIEPDTAAVIRNIQDVSAFAAGFTARGREIRFTYKLKEIPPNKGENLAAKKTVDELRDIEIDFSTHSNKFPKAWSDELNEFDGVFFTDGKSKKDFLLELVAKTGYQPKRIVFVDDSEGNVKALQAACQELGIEYHGFVYDHVINNPENLRTYWSFDPTKPNHLDALETGHKIVELLVNKNVFTEDEAASLQGITDAQDLMDQTLLLYYAKNGIL